MIYKHSPEYIDKYAKKSFNKIQELNLPVAPHLYELWYVFYADLIPELSHVIDMMEKKQVDFNLELCAELYDTFISNDEEIDHVRKTGGQIQSAIRDVNTIVNDVTQMTNDYSESLEKTCDRLDDEDCHPDEIKQLVRTIVSDTKNIVEQNKQLEEKLQKQTQLMLSLEKDLNEVRQEALTDGLTNIANRKAFDNEIKSLLSAMKESDESQTFSLIIMDIDHFKSFNDSYGHQVGDQVLRLVAKTLVEGVKGRDFIARYGGEEFAVLLPYTNQHAGLKVADELRQAVEKKQIVNRNTGKSLGRVTLSGGVTEYYAGDDQDTIIQRADQALYESKEKGRNMITMARIKLVRD